MNKYFTYLIKKDGKKIHLSSSSLNQLRNKRSSTCKKNDILYVSPILKADSQLPIQIKATIKRFEHGNR